MKKDSYLQSQELYVKYNYSNTRVVYLLNLAEERQTRKLPL